MAGASSTEDDPPRNAAISSAWSSLVRRSIEAWESLNPDMGVLQTSFLQSWDSLDDLLTQAPGSLMFWFFQKREAFLSQKAMTKWSNDRLDDYILLPATPGFVLRTDCFFVSHFWRSKEHPDPDGKYLRLIQNDLQQQTWSYVWVDWTCIPQSPRNDKEKAYFRRVLQTMSGIIRNSGFIYYYPPFEARLWILYEVAEYTLTSESELYVTEDLKEFTDHVKEMVQVGVRPTLERHQYKCTYEPDKDFLISWLEVLVLLQRLHVDIQGVRQLLDSLTWHPFAKQLIMTTEGILECSRFEGNLILNRQRHTFTPFPRLEIWPEHSRNIPTELRDSVPISGTWGFAPSETQPRPSS
ncbi:hypothetical protein BKA67DRAFT_537207 [Truncatella angustata]|uniref:Heterokaryon incompatibility domain-containing protein n=1 Tax=Truncatella angustata TaxID=152316 RepID=A0A9P8ZY05_9PEZI|nr:uncharacterized protein BKA67DRAFT_537207 [Truncatella angustata]KAH6653553.1 hypothetical protein BKA67DRAFT_537207 [Truncatella angustata]